MNFTPWRIRRHHEDHGELLVLNGNQAVMRDEGVVRQHRAGGDDLGAGDDEAGVGFLLDVTADVADFVRAAGRDRPADG